MREIGSGMLSPVVVRGVVPLGGEGPFEVSADERAQPAEILPPLRVRVS